MGARFWVAASKYPYKGCVDHYEELDNLKQCYERAETLIKEGYEIIDIGIRLIKKDDVVEKYQREESQS